MAFRNNVIVEGNKYLVDMSFLFSQKIYAFLKKNIYHN